MNSILRFLRSTILTVALVMGLAGKVVAQAAPCHCCCSPEGSETAIRCECCCHTPACECEIKSAEATKPVSAIFLTTPPASDLAPSLRWEYAPIPVPESLGTIPAPPEGELIRFGHSSLHERAPPRFS